MKFAFPILLIVTFLSYAKVIYFPFVSYDDNIHVYKNDKIVPVAQSSLESVWSSPTMRMYVPLTYTVWLTVARLTSSDDGKLNPMGFHFLNLFFHLINVFLVYWIVSRLTRRREVSILGATLFALHPIQVESVAWISSFRHVFGATFSLLTIASSMFWIHRPIGFSCAVLFFICALLSFPGSVVVPWIILVLLFLYSSEHRRSHISIFIVMLFLSIPFILLAKDLQPATEILSPIYLRPCFAMDAVSFYLKKLFLPFGLIPDYGRSPTDVIRNGFMFLPVVILLVCILRSKKNFFWLGLLSICLLSLLPTLGFVSYQYQRDSTVADRYMYLTFFGMSLLLSNTLKRGIGVLTLPFILVLGILTFFQANTWSNNRMLYGRILGLNPNSRDSYKALGEVLYLEGDVKGAIQLFQKEIKQQPNEPSLYNDLGQIFLRAEEYEMAEKQFNMALLLNPKNLVLIHNLKVAREMKKRILSGKESAIL